MYKYKISLIIPTLNSEKMLPGLFRCIKKQNFPIDKVEILIMDGGSTDSSVSIAKANGAKIISNPDVLAEPGVNLGMKMAGGELLTVMAVDNYLEQKNALSTLVKVFDDQSIVAAFPKHDSNKNDTIYTKYANTFTDPFSHFIYGSAANARTFKKIYKTIEHNDYYDLYDFNSNCVRPLIAFAQVFVIRSNYRRNNVDAFDDITPIMRLIEQNKKIAYVHSVSVYHHTISSLSHFIKKQKWATINAISGKNYGLSHRMNYLAPVQRLKIKIWPIYAISVVGPVVRSTYGFLDDREWLWFFHPVMCLISVYASVTAIIGYKLTNRQLSRQ